MNRVNKLKIFAITTALFIPTACVKDNSYKNDEIITTARYVRENSYDNNVVRVESDYSYPKLITTQATTTSTTTTTTTTTETTTTTVTTTIPDPYKDIRYLERVNNNDLDIASLNDFIIKYSEYAKIDYNTALQVINDNLASIENDYASIRGGIMCTLFTYSDNNGILSPYTSDREIREDMTQEEKESIMIEFCDNLAMCTDDKYIVLSAFREETGRGTSERCVYDNNYGGIRIYGEAGCNGEYGMYSTPEFGIYREVKLVYNKLSNIRSNGINDINSVVYSFACKYNPDYADYYSGKILGWVYDVQNDYGDFSSYGGYQKVYGE